MSNRKRTTPSPAPVAEPTVAKPAIEPVPRVKRAADGRPACRVEECGRPEFLEGMRLCGAHYATRSDLRKESRDG